jgi:chromate transporter
LFTTATFIGYTLAGAQGALLATVAIFLPAFLFVAISAPYLARLRESAAAGHFLDSVNVASLALMAVVAWNLGRSAIVDAATLAIAVGAAFALFRFRLNPSWLILAGAGLGLAGSLYRP